jgi:ribosomal protein S18 acetylase RimI-like enzyme
MGGCLRRPSSSSSSSAATPAPSYIVLDEPQPEWYTPSEYAAPTPTQRAHINACIGVARGNSDTLDDLNREAWNADLLLTPHGMLRVGNVYDVMFKGVIRRLASRDAVTRARVPRNAMYVATVATLPAHRRKGNADRMFRALLAKYGHVNLMLEVSTDNKEAMALYRKHGFRETYASEGGFLLIRRAK